jgi:parvulin-like peptidyl-prolyl isomerase
MLDTLIIGNRKISTDELLPLLAGYQLIPQIKRELIIDEAISDVVCTPEELTQVQQQFFQQYRITSEADLQNWMDYHSVMPSQLEGIMTRSLRIEKFKQETFGPKAEGHFLGRKAQFDKVLYSLIRMKDMAAAQEIYFRLQANEQPFDELAREYSQGAEAKTGGLVGPFEMATLQQPMANILAQSQPGQLWPPMTIGEWVVIIRMEQRISARLDEVMRQKLVNDLFNEWIQQELSSQSKMTNREAT